MLGFLIPDGVKLAAKISHHSLFPGAQASLSPRLSPCLHSLPPHTDVSHICIARVCVCVESRSQVMSRVMTPNLYSRPQLQQLARVLPGHRSPSRKHGVILA